MLRFLSNKSSGRLIFHPDDLDGCTVSRALGLFKPLEPDAGVNEAGAGVADLNQDAYVVEISSQKGLICLLGALLLGHLSAWPQRWFSLSAMKAVLPFMVVVPKWLTRYIISVQEHLHLKKPSCKPEPAWWILLFAVHALAYEAKPVVL